MLNGFSCNCAPGYTGVHCEEDVNECASSPCRNEAACTVSFDCMKCYSHSALSVTVNSHLFFLQDLVDDYSCACSPGWEGKNCSVDTNDCLVATCLNGGTCNVCKSN